MKFSVATLGNPGTRIPVEGSLTLSAQTVGTQQPFQQPVEVTGIAYNQGGVLRLSLTCTTQLTMLCDRCGVSCQVPFTLEREFLLTDGSVDDEADDEAIAITGEAVDCIEPLTLALLLEVPTYHVCHDDCLGLCPVCFCNRNDTECDCDTTPTDPRWDALKDWQPRD